jgi:hypothetical protein
MKKPVLLPYPRSLSLRPGVFVLPAKQPLSAIRFVRSPRAPEQAEAYALTVDRGGVRVEYRATDGLRAAAATLRQLFRQYGRRLPHVRIRDWPDFPRRGVMLDVSRGRVPKLEMLLELATSLADFKINELQLYTEHTFAYRRYKSAWQDWGALTGDEIRKLDRHCRSLGIELVPNQNSFGHLRYLLEHPAVKPLAEVSEPYEGSTGDFLRFPTTLSPNHPGTMPFLRGLYDELLPNFSSDLFNVGGDETWDLGRGQSAKICARLGKGRVYVNFLRALHRETTRRGKRMMFWGDIILNHPELLRDLPKDLIALNWGYEAGHPFDAQCATFAKSGLVFYVCPGTSAWMSMIGRHENALVNLRDAAIAGRKHGAMGYLNCDWGDGGHPQPPAVSWPLYVAGAALSWCEQSYDETMLEPVLSREVFHDSSGKMADTAMALGHAHLKFDFKESNITPFGAVIAAPEPHTRELFCRSGLKLYARIESRNIQRALRAVHSSRKKLARATPATVSGKLFRTELDLAARMAEASSEIMLWQKLLAGEKTKTAKVVARRIIKSLKQQKRDYARLWPQRNKATPQKSVPFLDWRIADCRLGKLHFAEAEARLPVKKTYAAE